MNNRMKIMYVEDDVIMGMEVKEMLENAGYEVCDVIASGSEAISTARSHKPDLVLMDIRLKGGMNGIEATKKIHSFSEAPVIYISGYKDDDMMRDASADRNTLFLSKPLDPDKLVAIIESLGGNM